MNERELLSLFDQPHEAGRRARAARTGASIVIEPDPPHARVCAEGAWPTAQDVLEGDQLVLQVDPNPTRRAAYVQWLHTLSAWERLPAFDLVPLGSSVAGLHTLWCIAAARIVLPPHVRIGVRHDLVGLRLAQLALGFGAEVIVGPLQADRRLPVAGVTRPNEATPAGIATLVRQAGLTPEVLAP